MPKEHTNKYTAVFTNLNQTIGKKEDIENKHLIGSG